MAIYDEQGRLKIRIDLEQSGAHAGSNEIHAHVRKWDAQGRWQGEDFVKLTKEGIKRKPQYEWLKTWLEQQLKDRSTKLSQQGIRGP